ADFFQGMQDYLNDTDHAYAYAKTVDYISIMETASGQSLSEFFSDWLYNQGYPTYTVEWNQLSATQVRVTLSQTQSDASVSFFEAPVPLRLVGTQGETLDVVLDNTLNNEEFLLSVNFTIANVLFDPESDLISKNNTVQLGIDQPQPDLAFLIYPNPASQSFTIQKPESLLVSEVRIFNTLGQLLYQNTWTPIIDVSSFSTGLLFIQLQTNIGIINKSLLKN
ncbi:MAG: T9SS type A sorting domain-containing protein, partial [Flavobacteriaceae bacterium]|nr:T9SS type A sorting domain-containing protein [Flavobacteriaceae bacterium]